MGKMPSFTIFPSNAPFPMGTLPAMILHFTFFTLHSPNPPFRVFSVFRGSNSLRRSWGHSMQKQAESENEISMRKILKKE